MNRCKKIKIMDMDTNFISIIIFYEALNMVMDKLLRLCWDIC
jgi:hypothetical protein